MPFIYLGNNEFEWYWPPQRASKSKCNTMKAVMAALKEALEPRCGYCKGEIELLVNEAKAGQRLHPAFRGKNAQTLLDRLVRNKKLTRVGDGFYALKELK